MIDPLLTAREGADLLQISVPTFWRWVSSGTLPKPVKLGGMSRWPKSELVGFVERAIAADLPPGRPSFITRVLGVDSGRFRVGQARRARSPQIAQAPGALLLAFGCPVRNVA